MQHINKQHNRPDSLLTAIGQERTKNEANSTIRQNILIPSRSNLSDGIACIN